MNINNINKQSIGMSIIFIIIANVSLFSISYIYSDVTLAINIQAGLLFGLAGFILIIMYPFHGLIAIILLGNFAHLFNIPLIESVNKLIGIPVAIGWFLKYIVKKKTIFFNLINFNIILLLFIASAITSSLLAKVPVDSFNNTVLLTLNILMVFFIQDFIKGSRRRLDIIIIAIATTAGLSSIIGIIQYVGALTGNIAIGNVHVGEGDVIRVGGFKGANSFGLFLLSHLPFSICIVENTKKKYLKTIFTLLFLINIIAIGLTVSRTAIYGIAAFLIIYFLMNIKHKLFTTKRMILLLTIFLIIAMLFSFFLSDIIKQRSLTLQDDSAIERYHIFLKSLNALINNPILGIGFNNIRYEKTPQNLSLYSAREGHDIVSILFVSLGGVGIIIFFILFIRTLLLFNKATKCFFIKNNRNMQNMIICFKAGMLSLLFVSLGSSPTDYKVFWIYLGLSSILHIYSDKFDEAPEGKIL